MVFCLTVKISQIFSSHCARHILVGWSHIVCTHHLWKKTNFLHKTTNTSLLLVRATLRCIQYVPMGDKPPVSLHCECTQAGSARAATVWSQQTHKVDGQTGCPLSPFPPPLDLLCTLRQGQFLEFPGFPRAFSLSDAAGQSHLYL